MKRMDGEDWKVGCLARMASVMSADGSDLPELDGVELGGKALRQVFKMLFPTVDLASLENGVSANLLGGFVGHQKAALNKLDSTRESLAVNCERIEVEGAKLSKRKTEFLARATQDDQELVARQVDKFAQMGAEMRDTLESVDTMIKKRPALEQAISDCLTVAASQSPAEARMFFDAFSNAIASPTMGADGQLLHSNPRTARIYVLLAAFGDHVKEVAGSVPELHRILARLVDDEILISDEESLQWGRDRKCLEGVCRQLGLSFRKSGRPLKKEIPNTK